MDVTVFLGGDVVTGRGIDQVLPHPGDPRLWEPVVRDARDYVRLAEAVNGPIPRPVDFSGPWGEALRVLDDVAPDARVINLETSVTRGGEADRRKRVHYRMTPENVGCLTAARPDVCALANNHVLDFGRRGFEDTLEALAAAGIGVAGAGHDAREAGRPAIIPAGPARVVVFAFGDVSSGIPGTGPPPRPGPGWPSCPTCPSPPPTRSSPGSRR
ncbi:CapA family protein [Actinosynnema sp. CA-248983]